MSKYNTLQTKNPFFERYCIQFRDMYKTDLDFITIWDQFCEVNNIVPKKPWHISSDELKNLARLTDHEIFLLIAEAIGNFWKGGYKGEGF